jgi:autotransporter-associated beta strand protein
LSWIGAVTGNTNDAAHIYNNAANWVGGVIDNSFSGVTFTGNTTLYFNASLTSGAAGINLGYSGGFNLTFESSSTTTQTLTLAGNITGAFGGASVTIGNAADGLDLDLGAATRTFNLSAGDTLAILNTLSGGVGVTKSGAGTLTLDGANSYSGTTSATAGQLNIGSATAVGTGAFNISGGKIDNVSGASLTLSNNVATLASFTFVGTNDLNLGSGAVTITGNRTFTVSAGNLTIGGPISQTGGPRKLTKAGAGTLTLSGANTFSGGMTISAGQLNIDNATAIGSGTFTITGGAIDNTSGVAVALSNNNLQSWNGNFTFIGSDPLDLGTGAVTLSANRIVTTDTETLTVDGVISGAHSLTASGAGTLVLTGSNAYSGGTTVSGGTLAADNAAGSATGSAAVVVSSGAALIGTGSISGAVTVTSGGTVAPGDGGTAILNTGALTLATGSNLDILLTDDTAGTGYSQINVNGAASISGSNLILSGSRSGHDGTLLTILASTSAITGTFTGLAQSGTVSNNGVNYTIDYTGGGGDNVVLTANLAATSTALGSSANPSVFGQSTTFTATVTSGSAGTPTGSVTFYDGATSLGTATVNGSAVASLSLSTLNVGSYSITATYGGDSDFITSTSTVTNQTVNQDTSTTTLVPSTNPSVFGQSVTLTATVSANSPGSGSPTGTVTFEEGTTTLGTGTLNVSGHATFNTSALLIGSNSLTAVYDGDSDFITSTSAALSLIVNRDGTTDTLTASTNPSVFGQSLTLTATVSANSPGAATPTGTVTFEDGTTTLGTGTLNVSGQATFNTSALLIGSNSLTAVYAGDTDFTTSTSSAVSQTVNQDGTTTSLTPSVNPSVFGESVTFTATVSSNTPGAGTPTGTVTFYDGLVDLGTTTLNGSAVATNSLSTLGVATHSVTAVYSGDSDFINSTSAATSQIVNQDSTSTTLVPSIDPSLFGQSVALTAAVIAHSPGGGTPTGTVTFKDGSATLAIGTLDGSGQVTFSTSALPIGVNSLTAIYAGDPHFTTSTSSATNQAVDQDGTTTSLTPSANPSVFGQSVTFTASVTSNTPDSGTPTGTITFYDGLNDLGTATLNGSAVATIALSTLSVATHSMNAVYSGDSDFISSTSSATSETVNQDSSTTTLAPSANPSVFGQSVTLTATVTANSPGAGTLTGTVTFKDGTTTLGAGTLNGSGEAMYRTALSVGSRSLTAVYGGDTNFTTSTSSTLSQIVDQDPTTSVVASSLSLIVFGQTETFTATVTSNFPGFATLTGTVAFMDGSTTLGTRTLNVSGQATLSTSALLAGTASISVYYAGDANFLTSTSPAISQAVDPDPTSVSLTSSTNPELFGQVVTFTATVTANSPGGGTPTGSITLDDGPTLLGTGTLDGAGEATLATSVLSAGTHPITAVFAGDANFTANISSAFSQVVDPLPAAKLAFAQQPLAVIAGDPITTTIVIEDVLGNIVTADNSSVTLTVNSGPASLGGTVSLSAQNGVATFSNVLLNTPGAYTLLASDGILSGAISSAFDVADAASNLVFASQPITVTAGDPATALTANLMTPAGAVDTAFNASVSLSIASGPPGGQILGSLEIAAQSGIAAWNDVRFTRAGTYTLKASTIGGLIAETAPIAVNPGPVAQTVVSTQPGMSWQFGVISPSPVIALTDQFGNIIPNAPASVIASILSGPPGAILTGITTVPVHNGYATFGDLTVNLSGIYSLTFTNGVQTPIVISDIQIVAIPGRRFSFNGIPLGQQSILLQQERNAPPYMARTPIALAAQFPLVNAYSPQFFAAAPMHLAPDDIVNPQFVVSGIFDEASPNSILNPISDSDRKLLESQRQIPG